jgi:hypothetical protein
MVAISRKAARPIRYARAASRRRLASSGARAGCPIGGGGTGFLRSNRRRPPVPAGPASRSRPSAAVGRRKRRSRAGAYVTSPAGRRRVRYGTLRAPRAAIGATAADRDHARDDRGQPSAKAVDARGLSMAEPQPRFLNGVVDLAQRAEHPVRHGAQMGSVLSNHSAKYSRSFIGHTSSSRSVITLTDERHAM